MENLLSLNFWFSSRPPRITETFEYILIFFLIFLLILAVFSFIKKRSGGKSKNFYIGFWRKFFYFCSTNLFIGTLLFLFNLERVYFLSARFWYVLWLVLILVWLFFIFRFVKKIPEKIKKAEKEEKYKKYIP